MNSYYVATGNPGLLQRRPVALPRAGARRHPAAAAAKFAAADAPRRADRGADEVMRADHARPDSAAPAGARRDARRGRESLSAQPFDTVVACPEHRRAAAGARPYTAPAARAGASAEAAARSRSGRCRTACRSGSWAMHKVPTVHLELAVRAGVRRRSGRQVRARQPDGGDARRRRRLARRAARSPTRSTSSAPSLSTRLVGRVVRRSARPGRAPRRRAADHGRRRRCGRRFPRRS